MHALDFGIASQRMELCVACAHGRMFSAAVEDDSALSSAHPRLGMMLPDPVASPPILQLPPAACATSDDVPADVGAQPPSSMVTVRCVSLEGATVELTFARDTTLRAMQKPLLRAFGKNYPYSSVAACVGEKAFSDFEDLPLRGALPGDTINVVFARQISDPSGYDQIDRKRGKHGNKVSLEDECRWEAQTIAGETDLGLDEWIFSTKNIGGQMSVVPSFSS